MSLRGRTRRLAAAAARAYADSPHAAAAADIARGLDEPLRVAIAGRVKAGKSTLLNGLIGQQLAATDAGECTRIVTWFQNGRAYRVLLYPRSGAAVQLPFSDTGSLADLDLLGHAPSAVERLVVDWPSQQLRGLTLIDTPGLGSVRTEVSGRTRELLAVEGAQSSPADAVIYLMRHVHGEDVSFLETFHDAGGEGRPVNTVGVLSRADEVGHSRTTALDSARRIAARYESDPRVRRLCHSVLPVAGLLASFAGTLRETEYQTLRALSGLDESQRRQLLLSTDRFIRLDTSGAADPATRIELLRRIGLFGARVSVELIRSGGARHSTELAEHLKRLSGIAPLQRLLRTQFAARADVLKARTALLALDRLFHLATPPDALARQSEEVRAGAHEFTEIRLIDALREDPTLLDPKDVPEAERLLGGQGPDAHSRLGLTPDADGARLRSAAFERLARWQREAEDPVATRQTRAAARILIRTCEGMLAAWGAD
jgi:hypothetical protein